MNTRVAVLGGCVLAGVTGLVFAGGPECAIPSPPTDARFVALTKLAGDWVTADEDKDGKPDGTANFRVTAAGSAVLETMFPGSDHEMITVYHMDKGRLRVTHYCALGNAPSMVASSGDAKRIEFAFDSGANIDPAKDMYMGHLVVEFVDLDHYKASWTDYTGRTPGDAHMFNWTRKK